MDNEALHAGGDSLFSNYERVQKDPKVKEKKTNTEKLARLSDNSDLTALIERIDEYIKHLQSLQVLEKGESIEAFGFRVLATNTTIEWLKRVKNLPKAAKVVVEHGS